MQNSNTITISNDKEYLMHPLHKAYSNGQTDILKLLCKIVTQSLLVMIKIAQTYLMHPLHKAYSNGQTDILKLLFNAK